MEEKNLNFIKEFIEGKMPVNEFKEYFFNNKSMQNLVSTENPAMVEKYGGTLNFMLHMNWNSPIKVVELTYVLDSLLIKNGIKFQRSEKYSKAASFYYNLLPAWIGEDAEDYVIDEIIEKAPKGLTKVELKKWVKERISETFRCEKSKPRWAQGGEWPRMPDGRFMIFRSQKKDGELVTYTFVNPDTGEEVKIEEYY